jgi:inosose dehydratase
MKIGCFALIEPLKPIDRQFELVREMGFDYTDLTDNHVGGSLGVEAGFAETISLDKHPADIQEMLDRYDLTFTSVCAHANLLDPTSPARYGTAELVKAIKLADFLDVDQVITTEQEPKTDAGRNLSRSEQITIIGDKLHEPVRWASELGIDLLLEPHGELTDSIGGMQAILEEVGHEDTVGVNHDTGNFWLGGGDPVEFVEVFGDRIKHVHWKDLGEDWVSKRGEVYGCGMALRPLGDGVIPIEEVIRALQDVGFDGPTTLEISGEENVKKSERRLRNWFL